MPPRFQQRLKALRKERRVTQTALARALGLSQQAVAKWESGLSSPDPDMLSRLAAYFGTGADILLGSGSPAAPAVPAKPASSGSGWSGSASPGLAPPGLELLEFAPAEQKLVPVLGEVRAGFGLPALEEDLGAAPAAVRDPERYFYLIVRGDSMEPRIREGDLALVRRQPALDDGDLGVVVYGDGEGALKRFHRKGDAVALQSFNPAYETLLLAGEDLERLYIIGKVVETRARW
ncbi:MAG: XRE family transcriptional regulator [Peptococcaceae bacterium]|nr:XRE family transcriptional regulator [Peptococcaceae bacterium]